MNAAIDTAPAGSREAAIQRGHRMLTSRLRRLVRVFACVGTALSLAPPVPGVASPENVISSATCRVVHKAKTAYFLRERVWAGALPLDAQSEQPAVKVSGAGQAHVHDVTGFVFGGLNSTKLTVRPVYGDRAPWEFAGSALARTNHAIYATFERVAGREWYMVTFDLRAQRAVVSFLSSDSLAVAGGLWALECN